MVLLRQHCEAMRCFRKFLIHDGVSNRPQLFERERFFEPALWIMEKFSLKKKKFLYSYICDLEHFQMISLRTVVLGWWDKLMWWFLWYSTYNEQWNCRSIYQEEWKTWYRFKSYETFHNYFASKTNGWIFPQNSFRWGSGRPKFFTKAIVCANRLGNSLYSFSNQFQGPWQIL